MVAPKTKTEEKKAEEAAEKKEAVPKKKKTKAQLVKEMKQKYTQEQMEKEAKEEVQHWIKEQETAKMMEKIEPHATVNLKEAPEALSSILDKAIYALEKNAAKEDVVQIMLTIQEQINKYASKQDAEALGIILQKIAARRPDAWEEVNKIAAKQGAKGGLETQVVVTVEEGLTKKYKVAPGAVEEWLNNYGRLDKSKIVPEEMMRVIGVVEHSKGKGKIPLQVTEEWLKLGKLKKPMTIMEEAALLLELHKRNAAGSEYLMKHAFEMEDKIFNMLEKKNLNSLKFALQDVIRESKNLEDAIFKALKHEDYAGILKGTGMDALLDESTGLGDFIDKLAKEDTPEAKKLLAVINELKDSFIELFAARTALLNIAGNKIGDELALAQGERAKEARQLFQSLQWSVIKEKLQLFGKNVIVGKFAQPWIEFGHAWKWGAAKEAGTWRPRAVATKKVLTQVGIIGGSLVVAAGLAYGAYWFFYKNPTEKAIEQFRKDFKKDFGTDFPLSNEAIKFYYGTDEGKRVLLELQDMYPTAEAISSLLNLNISTSKVLKEQVLGLSGIIIQPSKFDDLLEGLMEKAEKSDKEPEELVAESFDEWRKKGYVVTPGENYIMQYCKALDIPKKYTKEFMKNEGAFLAMWEYVNAGKLPRSLAAEYAEIAMGSLSYKEKQKKIGALLLKEPIVKGSVMDILDQYSLVNGDLASQYEDLLELYQKDAKARKNLNGYTIKKGDVIYGNFFGILAFANGVAKGEVTEENDPAKSMVSSEMKFMSPKGLPKEKHYWIWIGTDSVMKYFPSIAGNEKQLNFLMKYSGFDETGNPTGMLKWFMDNRERIKEPSKVLKFLGVSSKLFEEKYYNKSKGTYNYAGIEAYLNKKIPTLQDKGMLYAIDVPYEPDIIPTELIPRGEIFVETGTKSKKKIAISSQVIKDSEVLLGIVEGMVENFKDTKEYKLVTDVAKGGYTEAELLGKIKDFFLAQIALARDGNKDAIAFLKNKAGIEINEETKEPEMLDPDKTLNAIKKYVIKSEYEKLK